MFYSELKSPAMLNSTSISQNLTDQEEKEIDRFLFELEYLNYNFCNYFSLLDEIWYARWSNPVDLKKSMEEYMIAYCFIEFRKLIKDKKEKYGVYYFYQILRSKNLIFDEGIWYLEDEIKQLLEIIKQWASREYAHRSEDHWKEHFSITEIIEESNWESWKSMIKNTSYRVNRSGLTDIIWSFEKLLQIAFELFYVYSKKDFWLPSLPKSFEKAEFNFN